MMEGKNKTPQDWKNFLDNININSESGRLESNPLGDKHQQSGRVNPLNDFYNENVYGARGGYDPKTDTRRKDEWRGMSNAEREYRERTRQDREIGRVEGIQNQDILEYLPELIQLLSKRSAILQRFIETESNGESYLEQVKFINSRIKSLLAL